jgi:hypothetical protein
MLLEHSTNLYLLRRTSVNTELILSIKQMCLSKHYVGLIRCGLDNGRKRGSSTGGDNSFLGAFAKLRKATASFVMSACPSA